MRQKSNVALLQKPRWSLWYAQEVQSGGHDCKNDIAPSPTHSVCEFYFLCIQWSNYLSSSVLCLPAFLLTVFLLFLWLPVSFYMFFFFYCVSPLSLAFALFLSFPISIVFRVTGWRQAPPAPALAPFLPRSFYEYNHRPNLPLVSESICVSHISTRLLVINALEHTWVGHISVGLSSPPLPPCVCLWMYRWGFMSIMREWEWGHQSSGLDEVTP